MFSPSSFWPGKVSWIPHSKNLESVFPTRLDLWSLIFFYIELKFSRKKGKNMWRSCDKGKFARIFLRFSFIPCFYTTIIFSSKHTIQNKVKLKHNFKILFPVISASQSNPEDIFGSVIPKMQKAKSQRESKILNYNICFQVK